MSSLHIVVVGGGAAGFFGAITAAETFPDARVTILEKNRSVLGKVRVSGGGRCNVTHACFDNRLLIKNYPRGERWLRPLLNTFDAAATIRWFEANGVRLKTEADGRMFPTTDSSETIIDCLLQAAQRLRIQIRTSCGVATLSRSSDENQINSWLLQLTTGETVLANRVLIATGGYPQLSSYGWLPEQSEPLVPPVPSLFTLNVPDSYLLPLAGVSVANANVKIMGTKLEQHGPLLLTHWGFSGPAVLRLSAWGARVLAERNYHFTLRIHWIPALNEEEVRNSIQVFRHQNPKKQVTSQNPFGLPGRLWQALATEAGVEDTIRWADLPGKVQNRLIEKLTNSQFQVAGKTTFKEEFVTCGGIALDSLNPETLESNQHKGLFFAGEVLDVDGITGGFNFQNAWTTGYVAGKHIGFA